MLMILPVLDFWEDFAIVALIMDFFMIYKQVGNNFIYNKFVALLVAILITWLVFVPYLWLRWIYFFCFVLYTFIGALNDDFEKWWPGPT